MIKYLSPLLVFIVLAGFLAKGLYLNPKEIPSPLIGKKIPDFKLSGLSKESPLVFSDDLLGEPFIINVFASWCGPCLDEHPILIELADTKAIHVFGLNYKDNSSNALNWLEKHGNPYQSIGVDPKGVVAIDFGVYGVPETFLIDSDGFIRFKHVGPLNRETINEIFKILEELPK